MSTRKIIIGLLVCFSIAVFVGQLLSQTQNTGRTRAIPDWDRLTNMTAEERTKEIQRIQKQRQEQRRIQMQREIAQAHDEANRQLIGATQRQWLVIKPKIQKVRDIGAQQARASITLSYFRDDPNSSDKEAANQSKYKYSWKWHRPSERKKSDEGNSISDNIVAILEPKKSDELTEGEKICEELLDLLEDKNSKEEDIRQKVEALRKVRQEGKEELTKAQKELREVVNFRQEATLIMMGILD